MGWEARRPARSPRRSRLTPSKTGSASTSTPEQSLASRALAANARIHELSHSNDEHAGMGTTLTAVYVAAHEIAIAHVGDSRAYCLRDGELIRLTSDDSWP